MSNLIFISALAGILGTGMGGFLGACLGQRSSASLSNILSFAAGVMTSIVCFDLIPEALELSGLYITLVGIIAGVCIIMILNHWVDHTTAITEEQLALHASLEELHHEEGIIRKFGGNSQGNTSMYQAGVVMLLAIALHNFPEGIAIGSGTIHNQTLGLSLGLMIGLHNIPEGMSIAAPLVGGGVKRWLAVLYTALAGAATVVGAVFGYLLGGMSDVITALCFAFAGGAMLYVVYAEVIPQAITVEKDRTPALINLAGFLIGLILTYTAG